MCVEVLCRILDRHWMRHRATGFSRFRDRLLKSVGQATGPTAPEPAATIAVIEQDDLLLEQPPVRCLAAATSTSGANSA